MNFRSPHSRYKLLYDFGMCQTQEREAKENMKRKAKELQRQRQDALKTGRNVTSGYGGIGGVSGGINGAGRQDVQIVESVSVDNPKTSSYSSAAPTRYALLQFFLYFTG